MKNKSLAGGYIPVNYADSSKGYGEIRGWRFGGKSNK